MTFASFFQAYLECALWSSVDGSDTPMDQDYGIGDISEETLKALESEAKKFWLASEPFGAQKNPAQAGHDFWLTRNGHGAGFWDGDWEEGDALTAISEKFGGCTLYVGDDEKIHSMKG